MGKRGPKPKNEINLTWRPELAYAIGLLVTDGNVSKDGRHIIFVSKDIQQINNFNKCLGIKPKLGRAISGYDGKSAHRVQFGNVIFYNFLLSIGIMPAKSKIISEILLPDKYFFDFLRGCFDGDGCFYSYWDKRWRSSFMFYIEFVSASKKHIDWLRSEVLKKLGISGHVTKGKTSSVYQLKFAKAESLKLLAKLYYNPQVVCLSRKRKKIEEALAVVDKKLQTRGW